MPFGPPPPPGSMGAFPMHPGVTGRPQGRLTRPKPYYAMHANAAQMPEFVKTAKDLMNTYGSGGLPPGLQPRWLRNKTNLKISKGMTKGS